jgi:DNA polymerase III alpha subunit
MPASFNVIWCVTILNGKNKECDLIIYAIEQVKVLALTDHDTMAGIPEAMSAAHKFGMRIIPGVEISALHSPR